MAIKMNIVEERLNNYIHYWRGLPKTGKTTLFRDLVLELYNDPTKGLDVVFGNEYGHKSLSDLQYEEIKVWDSPADEEGNRGFVQLVDDLVRNNKQYGIELIAFDTIDKMIEVAIEEVKRLSYIETGKPCDSLNKAFGGYGRGREKLAELISTQTSRLIDIGLYPIVIGHSKKKEKTDEVTGNAYEIIASSLNNDYDGIFGNIAQIIMMVTIDKDIVDGKVVGTTRNMWFRNNGLVEAGSRFAGMPEKLPLSAKNYIEAFNIGVEESKKSKYGGTERVVDDGKADSAPANVSPDVDVAAVKKEISAAIKQGTITKNQYAVKMQEYGLKKLEEATPKQITEIKTALLG